MDGITYTHKCCRCEKEFIVTETLQTPGFRNMEYEICPYCGATNRKSMEVEFETQRLESDDA